MLCVCQPPRSVCAGRTPQIAQRVLSRAGNLNTNTMSWPLARPDTSSSPGLSHALLQQAHTLRPCEAHSSWRAVLHHRRPRNLRKGKPPHHNTVLWHSYLTKRKPVSGRLTSPPKRRAPPRGRASGADERARQRDSETRDDGQQGASPNLPPRRERRARGGCPGAVLYAGAAAAGAAQRLRRVRRRGLCRCCKRQALARTRAARRQRAAEGTAGLVARRRRSERAARPRAVPTRALLLLRRLRRRRRRRLHG